MTSKLNFAPSNILYIPLICSLCAGYSISNTASAEEYMEEIVVTATRREESLLNVPVAVSVVTGEQIRQQSLQDLDDLSTYVPGFSVTEGGEQTGITIRGFGSGINFGFDQSVGLFIDEIYSGRERQFRGKFMDISSVEVLRGPQATLFGKNTISGAVIVRTGQPTSEFGMSAHVEAGFGNVERQSFEGVVNGALTDTLDARLAVRASTDNGYQENTLTGKDEAQEDDWIIRPTFLWSPTDNLSIRTKFEYSKYEREGRHYQVSDIGGPFSDDTSALIPPAALSSYLTYDPKFEYAKNDLTSKQLETADVTSKNVVVEVTYDLDFGKLISVTGYSGYDSDDQRDVDWSPTTYTYEPISQEFNQYSQEFRLVSEVGDQFDYIVGFYAFKNDFYVDRRTDVNVEVWLLPYGVMPGDDIIFGGPAEYWRYANLRYLDQDTSSQALYAQGTWHFSNEWHLTLGLRWNREHKEETDRYDLSEFGKNRFLDLENNQDDIDLINGIRTVLGPNVDGIIADSRDSNGDLTETDFSPEITLTWDANASTMLYAKYVRGHKGGGFNSQTTGQETDPTFDNEVVDSYELGGKFQLDDGYINVALFRQDFDDLQTSVWTGVDFDVGNAGEARSQGIELDGRYQFSERFEVNASMIFLDAKFIDNKNNACSVPQLSFGADGCFDQNGVAFGTPGAVAPYFQDLTDERFATQIQGNLGMGYKVPLFDNFELLARADVNYTGDQENPRDRTIEQPAVTTLDFSATLRQDNGPWSIGLLVKNATDKSYYWYEFEAPSQPGTRIGYLAPPRTVALRFSYDQL